MPAIGLLKNCELDETYDGVTISAEAKFLIVSMATFRNNKQRYTAFLVCSYNYQSIAKQHYYRYTCKIIVDAESSQRSKGWHSYLHSTCTLFRVKTLFANWQTSGYQNIFLHYFAVTEGIGVRGGGAGDHRAWKISGQTLFSGQAQVAQKSWIIKYISVQWKIPGQLCASGQAQVAQKSWIIKNIHSIQ